LSSASQPTDEALVQRARGGEKRAFELLVLRHRAKVLNLAARMLPNRADAEDVAQEALLDCYRGLASFSGKAAFATWLHQIAVNAALMSRRAARRWPVRFDHLAPASGTSVCDESTSGEELPPPEESLDRARLVRLVERAVTPLDERSKAVFAMCAVAGASTREVAHALKLSPVAVRQRLHRARVSIRRQLAATHSG
jgi:RNA polymerase sigma-70 factor (ECF subfamily)